MRHHLTQLKERLLQESWIYRLYLWREAQRQRQARPQLDMIYREADLTPDYYAKIKHLGDPELEHQIGRLTNFKRIIPQLRSLTGDVIEFGTFRGFSMLWIAYLLERAAIFDKKIIGLDSFTGLPYNDGPFRKYAFSNTTLKECVNNLRHSRQLYDATKRNIFVCQCLYNEHARIAQYLQKRQVKNFCFIHIDCDVSQSAQEIFDFLIKYDLLAPTTYLLLDDYGHPTNLKNIVDRTLASLSSRWHIQEHSSTKLTKNFVLTRA